MILQDLWVVEDLWVVVVAQLPESAHFHLPNTICWKKLSHEWMSIPPIILKPVTNIPNKDQVYHGLGILTTLNHPSRNSAMSTERCTRVISTTVATSLSMLILPTATIWRRTLNTEREMHTWLFFMIISHYIWLEKLKSIIFDTKDGNKFFSASFSHTNHVSSNINPTSG